METLRIINARLFDPACGMDHRGDVGMGQGTILEVAEPGGLLQQYALTVDAQGALLCPGFVDIHAHVGGPEVAALSLPADEAGIGRGVTAVGDAGTAGARTLPLWRQHVEKAATQVRAFVNAHPDGISRLPEVWDAPLDVDALAQAAEAHADMICGFKIRATGAFAAVAGISGLTAVKELAARHRLPLMIHLGVEEGEFLPPHWEAFCRAVLETVDSGDVLSHCFTAHAGGCLPEDGRYTVLLAGAVQRGVLLDCAMAIRHCDFSVARRGMAQGFTPHCISTDLTTRNAHTRVFDLSTTMSRFMALGMGLEDVVTAVTRTARRVLGLPAVTLQPGAPAELTLAELRLCEDAAVGGQRGFVFPGMPHEPPFVGAARLVPMGCVAGGAWHAALPELW